MRMLNSFWGPGRSSRDAQIPVSIEQLAVNQRRINSSCLVRSPMEDVWAIITDYDRLSEHVPNLVQSRLLPNSDQAIRLFQEGAQKIIGFEFKASLTMDMTESRCDKPGSRRWMSVGFTLVESSMFQEFYGEWRISPARSDGHNSSELANMTELFYTVTIRPRSVVPVQALEWRIREDVPINMHAVKIASERLCRLRNETGPLVPQAK